MQIEFDDAKRQQTLVERGLDFAEAGEVFAGHTVSAPDDRKDYGEPRIITVGTLKTAWWCWSGRRVARFVASSA